MHYRVHAKATALAGLVAVAIAGNANAQKRYDPGATDTEIKIGNIMPYSGPASGYATIGKTEAAYFNKINAEGGINGRKINFISYDDGYSPPKGGGAGPQAGRIRRGAFDLQSAGHAEQQRDPEIHEFQEGAAGLRVERRRQMERSEELPVDHRLATELPGRSAHLCHLHPEELSRQDDRRALSERRFRQGLRHRASRRTRRPGEQADLIETSYETTTPTVDSQVVQIKGTNPDIFVNIATPKFAAQAIKKIAELKWTPIHFLTNVSGSIGGVMKPAGYENDQGILSTAYLKDPKDPDWKNDPAMNEWRAFMTKWYPEGDQDDAATVFAYGVAKGLEQVLRQCGDDLTRENVMRQASNLNFEIGIYLPGTRIKTSPTDFAPLEQLQMMRFKGESWERFGPVLSGEKSS